MACKCLKTRGLRSHPNGAEDLDRSATANFLHLSSPRGHRMKTLVLLRACHAETAGVEPPRWETPISHPSWLSIQRYLNHRRGRISRP
jgi:hypothetical protein